jgi:hypothetical protein
MGGVILKFSCCLLPSSSLFSLRLKFPLQISENLYGSGQ